MVMMFKMKSQVSTPYKIKTSLGCHMVKHKAWTSLFTNKTLQSNK